MKRDSFSQLVIYAAVGVVCVGASFLISLKFIGKTRAQDERGEAAAAVQQAADNANAAAAQAQQIQQETAPNAQTPPSAQTPSSAQTPPGAQTPPPPNSPPAAAAVSPGGPTNPSGPATSISELEGFLEPFIYDFVNRRDPFLPWAEYVPTEQAGPTRPLSPAQRFDLDQLRLVGIMWDVRDPKAMFMDPDSEVIVLGRDEGIGNRNGYIASIREGEVVVVEAIRKRGDIIYKTRVLRIER